MRPFYRLQSKDEKGGADPLKSWFKRKWRSKAPDGDIIEHHEENPPGLALLCPDCPGIKPGVESINLPLETAQSRSPVFMSRFSHVGLITRDFVELLGRKLVSQHLHLGKVILQGREILGLETFTGRFRNIIRGSRNPQFRKCGTCNQPSYFAVGDQYLSRAELCDVPISTDGHYLIVRDEVMDRIDRNRWNWLEILKLPVLETVRDGMPERLYDLPVE